jgi:ABC-2 type transport system permease protein
MWKVFVKTLREESRDLMALSLSLLLTPIFVGLYWLYFSGGSTVYQVMVLNNDQAVVAADGTVISAGEEVIAALQGEAYADGQEILRVKVVKDRGKAETALRNRKSQVLLIIPEKFSETVSAIMAGETPEPVEVTLVGDLTNPYYSIAAILAFTELDNYIQYSTNEIRPIQLNEIALGGSGARTEFELYIPGLLIFAIVMMLFDSSMIIAREAEAGTFKRLKITKLTTFELLGGLSAGVIFMSLVGLMITFGTAYLLGFRSYGSMWVALFIAVVTSFSVIGAGLMVAAFSKNSSQAFVLANFPLVLFMFFSGAIYPLPAVELFTVGEITVNLYDILPPTHAVVAMNKVLSLGVGLGDVAYEIIALIVLSAIYFTAGVWLFNRNHMRAM